MKSTTQLLALSALAILVTGSAWAAGPEVGTRSKADMEADLMRTYQTPGGESAGQIRTRSEKDRYSDLIRDWDGSQTKEAGSIVGVESSAPVVNTRSSEDAHDDLMRNWK